MKTIRILKYAFLLILVTTAVYYVSFFIKVYINHGSVGKTETLFGFWSLPLFIVSSFLYAFLSRASE
jgi:hypothetical protein